MQNNRDLSCLDGVFSKTPAEIIIQHLLDPQVEPKERRKYLVKFLNAKDGLPLLTTLYKDILDLEVAVLYQSQTSISRVVRDYFELRANDDNNQLFAIMKPSLDKLHQLHLFGGLPFHDDEETFSNVFPEIYKFIHELPDQKNYRSNTFDKFLRCFLECPNVIMFLEAKNPEKKHLYALFDLNDKIKSAFKVHDNITQWILDHLKANLEYALGVAVVEEKLPGLNLSQPAQSSRSEFAGLNESVLINESNESVVMIDDLNTSHVETRPSGFFAK